MEKNDTPENLLPIREEPTVTLPNVKNNPLYQDLNRLPAIHEQINKASKEIWEDQPAKPGPTRKLVLDELIEWIEDQSKKYSSFNNGEKDVSSILAIQKAQSLRKKEEENTPKWISVNDRLPEERMQAVLLFNGDAPNYNQHIFKGVWFSQTQTFTRDADDYPLMGTITHWMQLPPHPNV
jgi:hypothetical protein